MHDRAFPRTHDLRLLIQLAIVINPSFENYQETAELLTPYQMDVENLRALAEG